MIRATVTPSTTLEEVYEDRYRLERLLESPETTHRENLRAIAYFGQFLHGIGGQATIGDLSKDYLLAFREARMKAGSRRGRSPRKISPATANKEIRILRALEQFIFDEFAGQLGLDYPRRLQRLKELKRKPRAYSIAEVSAMLAAAAQEPGEIDSIPAGLWWSSQLATYYDTGLRRTALQSALWFNLSIEQRLLRVPAEDQKDDEEQIKEIHPDTMALILRIREPRRIKIWPYPFASDCPWYDGLHRIRKRAGLAELPVKPTHGFRASHATYLSEVAGIDAAAESCGHSTSQLTRNHYVDRTKLSAGRTASLLPRPAMPAVDLQRRLF